MSRIEWTDVTWNPVVGCTPVSPGCLNCYAATMARRLEAMGRPEYVGLTVRKGENDLEAGGGRGRDVFSGTVRCLEDRLVEPLKWRKPRMVFVNSMSDLFHESVTFEFIDKVFAVMALCPQHVFQVLTKRPERMAEWLVGRGWSSLMPTIEAVASLRPDTALMLHVRMIQATRPEGALVWPLPNVWLGASVEDQKRLDERVPHLLKCPAAVRFLSCEPLLGELRLEGRRLVSDETYHDVLLGLRGATCQRVAIAPDTTERVDWVIVGGESGANARACEVGWIRSIVRQCRAAGVPCFVKQLGSTPYSYEDDEAVRCQHCGTSGPVDIFDVMGADAGNVFCNTCGREIPCELNVRDRKGGDPAEWPEDLRVRELPGMEGR